MNLSVIYCTHQTAQLSVRERLAFSGGEVLARGYHGLRSLGERLEAVILSTCNRVEIYLAQPPTGSMPSLSQVAQFLAEVHQLPLDEFVGELRELTGPAAVKHLFDVVSSLDSMVLGEPQIVNQVKEAYRLAEANEACGPLTHALFQGAIHASSRVRTETRLSEGRVSIASVAVGDFARSIFDHFGDKLVLVIGAGEMAEETLRYLKDEGVRDVVVVNRSPERAAKLAAEWGGVAAPWNELDHWLARADVIVSTTGADKPVIDAARFQRARHDHRDRTAFILDLGAPRDFEPNVGQLENVFLYDIDSLQRTCEENRRARIREIDRAGVIIEDEVQKFLAEFYRRSSGDLVTRLREGWHDLAQQELERLFRKAPHFTQDDRDAVEECTRRIVNKLLHPPLEALRDESKDGAPHGLITALKRLFGL
ncbi:MAG TPA: glutamyl-tRNA reductase [Planctomycetaceae bacterium]|nr:glutamyl-tRNA reductase [Planctomycetaceae bacterium]